MPSHRPLVVLVHSSVSGRGQWRSLTARLEPRFRVEAIDLIGYGERAPWDGGRPQTLDDQAALIRAVAAELGPPFALVGHSFGATVALRAAAGLGDDLPGLVLLEPNPFSLLEGLPEYAEAAALCDVVRRAGADGDWERAAARFADYWSGPGSWTAMPEGRRQAFAAALAPNVHEWDAVMSAPAREDVAAVRARTLVVSARDTVAAIARIVSLLEELRPDWTFAVVERGGHMAPLTAPDLVDPLVERALLDWSG